jgi:hypothetical protein
MSKLNENAIKKKDGLYYEKKGKEFRGVCPKCGYSGIVYSINRSQFSVCEDCKIYWYIGDNLFSCWREMSEKDFKRNRKFLETCENADEIYKKSPLYKK